MDTIVLRVTMRVTNKLTMTLTIPFTLKYPYFQVIKIYNSKLDDREKRKRFVIDRGLIDRKEQQLVRGSVDFFLMIFM